MNSRRAIVGLTLLCALVFAFAAQPAMAVQGTTALTCVHVELGAAFEDEHCTKDAEGGEGWIHEEISAGVETLATASNNETGSKVKSPGLSGTIEKVKFSLEAGSFKTCANKAFVENKQKANGQMEAIGGFCGEFTGVKVTEPANCSVKNGEIKLNEKGRANTVVKEVGEKEEMYIEFLPPEGKPFASFTFEGLKCVLKGVTAEVTGNAKANVTTELERRDGPTLRFQLAKTLKVGGNEATFDGVFTVRMQAEVGIEENPIVLTTTEK